MAKTKPIKLTPEVHEALVKCVRKGIHLNIACGACRISYQTLCSWRRKGEKAKSDDNIYRRLCLDLEEAKALTIQREMTKIKNGKTKEGKQDWRAAEKFLKMAFPQDFKDVQKVEIEATGAVTHYEVQLPNNGRGDKKNGKQGKICHETLKYDDEDYKSIDYQPFTDICILIYFFMIISQLWAGV